MDDSAVTQPTEQPSPEGAVIPATGLALAFLTAAEKMEIMLATPTATETAAIGAEIIARRSEEDAPATELVAEELESAVKKLVAGRSGGVPKVMRKPARRTMASPPPKPPSGAAADALPRVAGAERFLSTSEVLQAYGYTGAAVPETLPTIACAKVVTVASPRHSRATSLLSPPSVCSPRPRSVSASLCKQAKKANSRVPRRWASDSKLGR
jgi:hypothetical protein